MAEKPPSDEYLRGIARWMDAYDALPPDVRTAVREATHDEHHSPHTLARAARVLNPITVANEVRRKDAFLLAQKARVR